MPGQEQGKQGPDLVADLFETEYERIARYIYVRIGDAGVAEELASDVFLRALERIDSFQWRGAPIQAWLFRIAHNLAVDHLRKSSRRRSSPIEEAANMASADDPAASAMLSLDREELMEAMTLLTDAQREVVSLRFFGGLSSAEVAQIVNRSNGAVRELQSAALKALRRVLQAATVEVAPVEER